jgi:hypothetical protein
MLIIHSASVLLPDLKAALLFHRGGSQTPVYHIPGLRCPFLPSFNLVGLG